MGIACRYDGGKTYPVITCDYCGEEIERLEQGIITSNEHSSDSSFINVHIYHVSCDQRENYSEKLSEILPWLLWNHNWGKKGRDDNGWTITMQVPNPSALDRPPQLLTVTEAAIYMHVSRETIYQWIKTKKINPVLTPSGKYRIPEEQLLIEVNPE